MNYSFYSDYSWAWLFVLLLISIAVSGYTYIYHYQTLAISKAKALVLFTMRLIALFLIGLFLLNPVIKTVNKKVQKPVVVFAQDNSESLVLTKDSLKLKDQYQAKVRKVIDELAQKYEVKQINFGNEVVDTIDFSFKDQYTNFSPLFSTLSRDLYNSNLGALIIASDGIFNKGIDPESLALNSKLPIYTIALGDTVPESDLRISDLIYNKKVFKRNRFPVFITIEANGLANQNSQVTIKSGNKIVQQRSVAISENQYYEKFSFMLDANQDGLQRFDVIIDPARGEKNTDNNYRSFFIEVEDNIKQILLVQNSWHPDVAAIKTAVDANPAYKMVVKNAGEPIDSLEKYSLFILHQLPSEKDNLSAILKVSSKKSTPILYILGEQTQIAAFNQLNTGITIQGFKQDYDNTNGLFNENFSLFKLQTDAKIMDQFQPVHVPFGNYKVVNPANILIYQTLGGLNTGKPVIYFNNSNNQKTGVICGEGIWRWELSNYQLNQSHDLFNEIILKTLQYLLVSPSKEPLQVDIPRLIDAGQPLNIQARIYNESQELTIVPELSFTLIDSLGNTFPYVFKKTSVNYELSIYGLAVGEYQYKAEATLSDKKLSCNGKFIVSKSQYERINLVANYNILNRMAIHTGGQSYTIDNFENLVGDLNNNSQLKPIIYGIKGLINLLNLKVLFFIIVLILSTEWLLRKLWGLK